MQNKTASKTSPYCMFVRFAEVYSVSKKYMRKGVLYKFKTYNVIIQKDR